MNASTTPILYSHTLHCDVRGEFSEIFRLDRDFDVHFVQENASISFAGVVRGLHYQLKTPQAKLITVLDGTLTDYVLDLRYDSPTFGELKTFTLSSFDSLFIPPFYAHGFFAHSRTALIYKCSNYYNPLDSFGVQIRPFLPTVLWYWTAARPLISNQDLNWPKLEDLPPSLLFKSEDFK